MVHGVPPVEWPEGNNEDSVGLGGMIVRSVIDEFDDSIHQLKSISSNSKSNFGRGGIITKCHTAQRVAGFGISVKIANGRSTNIIDRLLKGEKVGTHFNPSKSTSSFKKWIANAHALAKGHVVVNEGAKNRLKSNNAASLLPIGVVKIEGEFRKGDIIKILDEHHKEIGLGQTKYGSKKAEAVIGLKNQKPIIHYDHLYLH